MFQCWMEESWIMVMAKDGDFDTLEIINAIRFCLGKEPIVETGKKRGNNEEVEPHYFSVSGNLDEDIDLAELFLK